MANIMAVQNLSYTPTITFADAVSVFIQVNVSNTDNSTTVSLFTELYHINLDISGTHKRTRIDPLNIITKFLVCGLEGHC